MQQHHLLGPSLVVVLIIGLVAIGCLGSSQTTAMNGSEQQLVDRIGTLEQQNADLRQQLDQQNLSVSSYEDQLAFYRDLSTGMVTRFSTGAAAPLMGTASLEAPAVLQRTVYERDGPWMTERTEQEGSLLNVTVDIEQGTGGSWSIRPR